MKCQAVSPRAEEAFPWNILRDAAHLVRCHKGNRVSARLAAEAYAVCASNTLAASWGEIAKACATVPQDYPETWQR